ncbi:MAG: type IV pilus modification protein PilV [Desulfobacterales bacterium]|nr:type IV pilus modification protein PilV [Desulfobacterales bacterium]
MIEVMIALVILAVGLLALMTMQIVSIRANAFSSEMTYASMLAQTRLERIRNMPYNSVQTISPDESVDASASTKGMAYTVKTTVADNFPATNMKTITLTVNWEGSPAGAATGEQTVDFTTSFVTVITHP